jgi:hypothetical protein
MVFTPQTEAWSVKLVASTQNVVISEVAVAIDALSLKQTIPPVVIDLNHDGLLSYSHAVVDFKGDGQLAQTTWAGAQDGILVWNKFGDGSVHNDSQYAFAQYGGATDLQGLAAGFDSNHDGVFDARDARFAEFAAWQDANQNGVCDAGEMRSLSQVGLTSINLVSDGVVRTPAEGVTEHGQTTATTTDGIQVLVADVSFGYTQLSVSLHTDAQGLEMAQISDGAALAFGQLGNIGNHAVGVVDLKSDAAANTLSVQSKDVIDLAGINRINSTDTILVSGPALSSNMLQHQLAVFGDALDSVQLDAAAWSSTGTVVNYAGHNLAVYDSVNGSAQLYLEQAMVAAGHAVI